MNPQQQRDERRAGEDEKGRAPLKSQRETGGEGDEPPTQSSCIHSHSHALSLEHGYALRPNTRPHTDTQHVLLSSATT